MKEQCVTNVRRIKVRRDGTFKDTITFVFTFNTSVLPKQLKVAFFRVSVYPYTPNPLRCYARQVYGHHENKCHREEICANCGQPNHSADETDCKRPAKCINFKEDHPADSRQCQAWHAENEILKEKYTRNISLPEARKSLKATRHHRVKFMLASQRLLVSVSCVDAATQTDSRTHHRISTVFVLQCSMNRSISRFRMRHVGNAFSKRKTESGKSWQKA